MWVTSKATTSPRPGISWRKSRTVAESRALQHRLREVVLFLAQPASGGHGFAHVEAVGQVAIEDGAEAQFQHEQRMLDEIAT
jgi:hypothetical protein